MANFTAEEQAQWDALGTKPDWTDEDDELYAQLTAKRDAPDGATSDDPAGGSDESSGGSSRVDYAAMSDRDFKALLDGDEAGAFVSPEDRQAAKALTERDFEGRTDFENMSNAEFERMLETLVV